MCRQCCCTHQYHAVFPKLFSIAANDEPISRTCQSCQGCTLGQRYQIIHTGKWISCRSLNQGVAWLTRMALHHESTEPVECPRQSFMLKLNCRHKQALCPLGALAGTVSAGGTSSHCTLQGNCCPMLLVSGLNDGGNSCRGSTTEQLTFLSKDRMLTAICKAAKRTPQHSTTVIYICARSTPNQMRFHYVSVQGHFAGPARSQVAKYPISSRHR